MGTGHQPGPPGPAALRNMSCFVSILIIINCKPSVSFTWVNISQISASEQRSYIDRLPTRPLNIQRYIFLLSSLTGAVHLRREDFLLWLVVLPNIWRYVGLVSPPLTVHTLGPATPSKTQIISHIPCRDTQLCRQPQPTIQHLVSGLQPSSYTSHYCHMYQHLQHLQPGPADHVCGSSSSLKDYPQS